VTRRVRGSPWGLAVVGALACCSCAGREAQLEQHREKLESLTKTTAAVGQAWLSGDASGIYARTALEQTFALLEQERRALAKDADALLDARARRLTDRADRTSRAVVFILQDVIRADPQSLRQHLSGLSLPPPETR
jgi:hypothetical protein